MQKAISIFLHHFLPLSPGLISAYLCVSTPFSLPFQTNFPSHGCPTPVVALLLSSNMSRMTTITALQLEPPGREFDFLSLSQVGNLPNFIQSLGLVAKVPSTDMGGTLQREAISHTCGAFPLILNSWVGSFEQKSLMVKSLGFGVRLNIMDGSYHSATYGLYNSTNHLNMLNLRSLL